MKTSRLYSGRFENPISHKITRLEQKLAVVSATCISISQVVSHCDVFSGDKPYEYGVTTQCFEDGICFHHQGWWYQSEHEAYYSPLSGPEVHNTELYPYFSVHIHDFALNAESTLRYRLYHMTYLVWKIKKVWQYCSECMLGGGGTLVDYVFIAITDVTLRRLYVICWDNFWRSFIVLWSLGPDRSRVLFRRRLVGVPQNV
jgi:hypothetical protein